MSGDLVSRTQNQIAPQRMSRAGLKRAQEKYEDDVVWAQHEQRKADFTYALAQQHMGHLGGLADRGENVVIEHDQERQGKTRHLDEEATFRTSSGLDKIEHALHDSLGMAIKLYAIRVGLRQ
jgi:hypothetical protein